MASFKALDRLAQLSEGQSRVYDLGEFEVVVFKVANAFYAIENRCSHDDGALWGGELTHLSIRCPRHGAEFCLKTGAALCPPAYEPVRVVPIHIADGYFGVMEPIDA
jgi:3-phenylpropionate/trans-cinnamate dioxygenase ferredoxin component